jgi:predicted aspartyl protease
MTPPCGTSIFPPVAKKGFGKWQKGALENATAHVRRHGSLFRICTRRLNVKTYLTAAIATAVMMATGGSAHAQQEQAMSSACAVWNNMGDKIPNGSVACTPYSDGIWITMQGNWSDNDSGQALDAACRKLMDKTMQTFSMNGMIFRLTEIDNRERQVSTTCRADAPAPAASADLAAPAATTSTSTSTYGSRMVTADYIKGHYFVKGSIDGRAWGFAIDTGATGSVIDRKDIKLLRDARFIGTVDDQLADGSHIQDQVYLIHNVCVGNACVRDLQVTLSDGVTLLGTDFIEATGVSVSIKDNVMTLTAE